MGYDTVIVTVSPLGINEIKSEVFKIYPTPVKEILNIECTNINGEIKITDVLGNVIRQQKITENKTTIDVTDFKNGVYFVGIKTKQKTYTKKTVVQH